MASLIFRAHGQHRSIILINATTLKSARYLLKPQLGISSKIYSHSELFPIYSSGHGSGNSPGLWCTISSVLFVMYKTQAFGASFYSPDKTIAVKLYMIGFVDDTSGSTNDFLLPEPAPLHHYANLATHNANDGMTYYNCLVVHSRTPNAHTTLCITNSPETANPFSKVGLLIQPSRFALTTTSPQLL